MEQIQDLLLPRSHRVLLRHRQARQQPSSPGEPPQVQHRQGVPERFDRRGAHGAALVAQLNQAGDQLGAGLRKSRALHHPLLPQRPRHHPAHCQPPRRPRLQGVPHLLPDPEAPAELHQGVHGLLRGPAQGAPQQGQEVGHQGAGPLLGEVDGLGQNHHQLQRLRRPGPVPLQRTHRCVRDLPQRRPWPEPPPAPAPPPPRPRPPATHPPLRP
mmetsp:Transcript_52346/g.138783  ORF Transcript_52346/g.138783 Transcript_52346/m.138783 type:complete len:213 (+) Transcript_52346:1119-1757(+)